MKSITGKNLLQCPGIPVRLVGMSNCSQCAAPLPDSSRFCPACGAVQPDATILSDDALQTTPMGPRTSPGAATGTAVTGLAGGGGRFIPGAMVAGRYRIVGLLGRGGMGEVYRADDLKLGQAVALKFLPPGLEQSPTRLERFLNEVRTALKVTHPNVCRVFDIGEVDGQHYLSMEYVDGEDLSSLLRRIGRLPHERAVQVARQICAGLAAAHEQGILHRDLKPANVMIDGRGQVRLTDFGLAGLADAIGEEDVTSGTPGYMAPEQLLGREVTVRSDVYALGLLLYELFTGRPVFTGSTVEDFRHAHTQSQPSSPSTLIDGIDPAVERILMHCLEKDPAARPGSVLAVSAALPGGDPLAAALAAGETPSPELVAEAGNREGMNPGKALLLGLCALLVTLGAARWGGQLSITHYLPLDKRPEVLADRAQSLLAEVGYTEPAYSDPVDHAWGFSPWNGIYDEISAVDSTRTRWDRLRDRPDAAAFWYRQSPRLLIPRPYYGPIFTRGNVRMLNPSPVVSGEVVVLLDLDGRLRRLEALPKRFSTREVAEPDWSPLFALADLDTTRFTPDRPRYRRYMAPDLVRAWVGTRADRPDVELRVEAGAFEGRPVLFNVSTYSSLESLGEDPEPWRPDLAWYVSNSLQPALILVVALGSAFLSRRNLHQGRSDKRGSLRFALVAFVMFMVAQSLRSHAMGTATWADEIWPLIVGAVFVSGISWAMYSAAEPLGRRVWPTMFVSSSRLLSRPRIQWRDPIVGKSVLVGVLAGGIRMLIDSPLRWYIGLWVSGDPPRPLGYNFQMLEGSRQAASWIFDISLLFGFTMIFVVALIGIRMMVKKRIPTLVLTLVVWVLLSGPSSVSDLVFTLVVTGIGLFVLLRWGVLAYFLAFYMMEVTDMARAADLSAWHAQGPVIATVLIVALTVYGTWAASGRRGTSAT